MKSAAYFAGGLVLFSTAAAAQNTGLASGADPTISAFQQTIQLAKDGLPNLQALVPWLVAFAIGTIVLAAASSIIQASDKSWVKPTTVVLGAAVTLIGSVRAAFFAIDYATCSQTVSDMRGLISKAEGEIQNYQRDGLPDSVRVKYLQQVEGDVDTLRKLDSSAAAGELREAYVLEKSIIH